MSSSSSPPSAGQPALSRKTAALVAALSLLVAMAVWLPALRFFFEPAAIDGASLPPATDALARRFAAQWSGDQPKGDQPKGDQRSPADLAWARRVNPEWDFMARTYQVLSFVNLALRQPDRRDAHLAVIDTIIDDTLRLERDQGMHYFLLPYAKRRPFVVQPERSIFIDGEIALMLGARRLLAEREDYRLAHRKRVEGMVAQMEQSPVLSGESYPNECWTFCNTVALASIRMADVLDDSAVDHHDLIQRWLQTAREKLVHPDTGLLVSSYTPDGQWLDGPEGSTIWMVAHALQLVDEDFARDQYERARAELGQQWLGFGSAREWPRSWRGPQDVDSGLILAGLDISAGSSGLACWAPAPSTIRTSFAA